MGRIETEAFKVKIPSGNIFVKRWIPEAALSKDPIVLLHDSLGSVALWRDFPSALARTLSRTVIAYDRLGFGRSDARHGLPSLNFIKEESTDYFPAVKKELSLTSFILLGHSVGGAMSIHIAARDKDCSAVVTMSAQAFVEERTLEGIRKGKRMFAQPGQIERLAKWHGNKAQWVLRAWTDIWLSPAFFAWSLADCIGEVTCPVLAIHGDNDEYGSVAFPEFIAGKVAGVSEMRVFKGCGHMPHRENTDAVVNAVRDFLQANMR